MEKENAAEEPPGLRSSAEKDSPAPAAISLNNTRAMKSDTNMKDGSPQQSKAIDRTTHNMTEPETRQGARQ
jgi:hypothetical protein|tara:strand:+ start:264 stop:476 length:213 start_codon:yes stop_codon:yes gene_type:complete